MIENEKPSEDIQDIESTPSESEESVERAGVEETAQTPRAMVEESLRKNPDFRWYVLKVITGHENKVHALMKEYLKIKGLEAHVGAVLVPSEDIIEKRSGKSRKVNKKFFPGYMMIHMDMQDSVWQLIRSISGAQGFIGGVRNKPLPVPYSEVESVLKKLGNEKGVVKQKVIFDPGESVRVVDGPFADFNGVVEEVHYEKSKLVVAVLIFGRSTPVELEFSQVEKTR